MSANFRSGGIHPSEKVLAYLLEQKVATVDQLRAHCFPNYHKRYAWKALDRLIVSGLIKIQVINSRSTKSCRAISLTNFGLGALRRESGAPFENAQIESNYPAHDVRLSDIRNKFAFISECQIFLPENILQMGILECDFPEIVLFRSLRVDGAARLKLGEKTVWMVIEFERAYKSPSRYKDRLKRYYQNDDLKAVILITETPELKNHLSILEETLYPSQQRKVLFSDLDTFISSSEKVTFSTSGGSSLFLHIGKIPSPLYPSVDQSFVQRLK